MSKTPSPKQRAAPDSFNPLPPSPPASPPHAAAPPSPLPPAAQVIVETLRNLHSGREPRRGGTRIAFHIVVADFARLHDAFLAPETDCGESDDFRAWCCGKLRWDWDPEEEEFAARMPNAAHEEFVKLVREGALARRDVLAGRWRAAGQESAAEVLDMIGNAGHTTIVFDHRERVKYGIEQEEERGDTEDGDLQPSGGAASASFQGQPSIGSASTSFESRDTEGRAPQRQADIVMSHELQRHYPPLVMEIANSEDAASVSTAGEVFILQSDNFIKTAVGFKLPFNPRPQTRMRRRRSKKPPPPPSPTATVWLWRSTLVNGIGDVETIMGEKPFRNDQGQAARGTLDLQVRDFMPPAILYNKDRSSTNVLTQAQLDETLARFTFAELTDMLNKAEEVQRKGWQPPEHVFAQEGQTGTRKRKAKSPASQWEGTIAADRELASTTATTDTSVKEAPPSYEENRPGSIATRAMKRRKSGENG